jgi:acetyl esterase/lipase
MLGLVVAGCTDGTESDVPRQPPAASVEPATGPTEELMATTPPGDFYAIPDPLPPGEPGDLIRAQEVVAPDGARAWRILYHSRSLQGSDIAVSGVVIAPVATAPPGGYPVLAYAHGTTGLGDSCAPSKDARPLDTPGSTGQVPLTALWDGASVVAATDYEGLGTPGRHPYLVGGSEARGVLDAVRALRGLPEAGAGADTIAVGVSQGGHAALFTGEIAGAYAPDVALRGVVALAPAAELAQASFLLTGDPSVTGFGVAIAAGFAAAYPEVNLETALTPSALEALEVVDTGCIEDVLAAYAASASDVLRLSALLEPPWPGLLDANSPGRVRTDVPVFIGQGTADPLIVPELTDALVARMCAAGDDVTYRRYIGAAHGDVVESARADALAWIAERLAGTATGSEDCPG